MTRRAWIIVIVFVAVAIVAALFIFRPKTVTGNVDSFAQCLTDKGVKMYGAYWCSHCQNQKKLFGDSWSKVTYVECGVEGDPRGQTEVCKQAGIQSYPTWEFSGGVRKSGEQTLRALSETSGCSLGAAT